MKQAIFSLIRFSKAERNGLAIMAAACMIWLLIRCTLHLWVSPAGIDPAAQRRMTTAYALWKSGQDSAMGQPLPGDIAAASGNSLFVFDPNTLDSAGFIRLGLPAKAVRGLLSWRSKGKHFYKPEELKTLYNLPPETYARIAAFIRIDKDEETDRFPAKSFSDRYPAIPQIIDLNTTDSATLDRGINGIGATLAHKIIARRTALGGFLRHEQLMEVYKFPDSTFQVLRERLRIDPASVRKMHLNTATQEQLGSHPYIGDKMAKNILLLREGIRRYESVDQLRQVPLMTEEIYRKIAPYFVVD